MSVITNMIRKACKRKTKRKERKQEVHSKHIVDERDFTHDRRGLQEEEYKKIRQ
jgi:hypothetical protein